MSNKTDNRTKTQPKRSGGSSCCIIGCTNYSYNTKNKKVKFYRFPKLAHLQERREKWISLVNRAGPDNCSSWQPTVNSRICSDHFLGNEKSDHPMSPSYNPSLFPGDRKRPRDSAALISRFNRQLKRQILERQKLNGNSPKCEPRFEEVFVEGQPLSDVDLIVDKSVQVYYPETKESSHTNDALLCSVYRIDNVCDVQTQTYIALKHKRTCELKRLCEKPCSAKNVVPIVTCSTTDNAVKQQEMALKVLNDHNYFIKQN